MKYFKFPLYSEPKPINNTELLKVYNECWDWMKKYRGLKNGTKECFTDDKWAEIIDGYDELLAKYPYPFTSNLLNTLLSELKARGLAAYTYEEDNE